VWGGGKKGRIVLLGQFTAAGGRGGKKMGERVLDQICPLVAEEKKGSVVRSEGLLVTWLACGEKRKKKKKKKEVSRSSRFKRGGGGDRV